MAISAVGCWVYCHNSWRHSRLSAWNGQWILEAGELRELITRQGYQCQPQTNSNPINTQLHRLPHNHEQLQSMKCMTLGSQPVLKRDETPLAMWGYRVFKEGS